MKEERRSSSEMDTPKATKKESRKILRRSKTTIKENPDRFIGDGIDFRAKIIGTERVVDARGNRMCQGALQRLKAAVKASGEHKQRILLNISLDGIIIKEEKSGSVLHHHPIHKISFISQDTADSRAFGYVFGCPVQGHDFFAIKTDKMASQVVLTLRDLFLTALDLKKKEMDNAMEEQVTEEDGGAAKSTPIENGNSAERNGKHSEETSCEEPAVDTLLDLKFSVDSLKQGISHMDQSIARGFGFSFSEDDTSDSVPFHFKMDKLSSLYQETLSVSSRSSSASVCAEEKRDASSEHSFSNELQEDRYAVFLEDIDALPSVFDPVGPSEEKTCDTPVDREDFFHSLNQSPVKVLEAEETNHSQVLFTDPPADRIDFFHTNKPQSKSHDEHPTVNPFSLPPALPPKKIPFQDDPPWDKNPFNPFSVEDDLPPPSSPPPPPPPRLPSHSPPPRPPGRPPPLAWASFGEDIVPPLPSPARKKPMQQHDAPMPITEQDTTKSQCFPSLQENRMTPPPVPLLDTKEDVFEKLFVDVRSKLSFDQNCKEFVDQSQHWFPPRPEKRRNSTEKETKHTSLESTVPPSLAAPVLRLQEQVKKAQEVFVEAASPPLPPKPHPSDSSLCASATSSGTHSSSSLAFSSSGDSKMGSCGEPLVSSWDGEPSPDSIFRRKSDPFADEFFLTLPKRSANRIGVHCENFKT